MSKYPEELLDKIWDEILDSTNDELHNVLRKLQIENNLLKIKLDNDTDNIFRYHDLSKNPDDLPKDGDMVLVYWVGSSRNWYGVMFWNARKRSFMNGNKPHPAYRFGDALYGDVLKWKYIEPAEVY